MRKKKTPFFAPWLLAIKVTPLPRGGSPGHGIWCIQSANVPQLRHPKQAPSCHPASSELLRHAFVDFVELIETPWLRAAFVPHPQGSLDAIHQDDQHTPTQPVAWCRVDGTSKGSPHERNGNVDPCISATCVHRGSALPLEMSTYFQPNHHDKLYSSWPKKRSPQHTVEVLSLEPRKSLGVDSESGRSTCPLPISIADAMVQRPDGRLSCPWTAHPWQ